MAPKGIVIQITGDGASAAKALELVDQHLRETAAAGKESAAGISEAMRSVRESLEMVGLTVGIGEAVAKVKEMVASTLEFGEAIEKAHEKTGLAVGTLSVLHYAAAITGTDFDGVTKAVGKMGASIGNAADGNDKKASAFLKSLGLDAKELASRSDGAEIAFKRVAQAIAATESPVRRLELAQGLLKKAGQESIPMLLEIGNHWDEWKQKAQAAGVYLDGPGAEALAATNKRLNDLQQHIAGAGVAFTEGLTPGLLQMLDTIQGGGSTMDLMKTWGEAIIRILAGVTSVFYSAASGAESLFGAIETQIPGQLVAAGKDFDAAQELAEKAAKFRDLAMNGPTKAPRGMGDDVADFLDRNHLGGRGGNKPGAFDHVDPTEGKTKKGKGDNGIAEQAAALDQANNAAHLEALKAADQLELTQMEADHKLFLSTDADYYRDKLAVQKLELNQEEEALRANLASKQTLLAKQHTDPKLTRDKSGNSAEELKTQKEILDTQTKIAAIEEKKAALNINAGLAATERADAVHLASLKAAATMEEHTNAGISARLALMQQEQALTMKKTTSEGGDTKGLAALQAQEKELLQIAEAERMINQVKEEGALKAAALKDAIEKNPTLRKQDTKELNALNQQTAATLKELVAQYDALAAELGGDFIQKAKALHAELDTLNRPDKKPDLQPYKQLGEGMTTMAEQMARATGTGREGFHKMVMSMEQDLVELAVKFAAQKWLAPFMTGLGQNMGGGGGGGGTPDLSPGNFPGFASGGDPTGPSMVGENGPELFFPKGPGTIVPNGALSELSKSGGGGMPNMTMNVTNASSQPVTARQTGSSFDADAKSYMTHVILEDLSQGGPISSALRPGF
jgi:hypothetical protein